MYTTAKAIVALVLTATAVKVGSDQVPPKDTAAAVQSTPRAARADAPTQVAEAEPPTQQQQQPQRAEPPRASNDAEVTQLRAEVAELQQRTLMLEQQAMRDRAQFDAVAQQMSDIRDAAVQREGREQGRADRAEQNQSAASGLVPALQSLEVGQSDIGSALDDAEQTFTGAALRDVQNARSALDNKDLASARYFLAQAIREAESGR